MTDMSLSETCDKNIQNETLNIVTSLNSDISGIHLVSLTGIVQFVFNFV
jgi:hypothetical protein